MDAFHAVGTGRELLTCGEYVRTMTLSPRTIGLVSLAALVPAVAFVVLKSELVAAVALVNVLIISGSIALALSPHEESGHEGVPDANGV